MNIKKLYEDVKLEKEQAILVEEADMSGFKGVGEYAKQLGVSQDKLAGMFADFDDADDKQDALKELNRYLKTFGNQIGSNPEKAVQNLLDHADNPAQKDALAELAAQAFPKAKDAFKNAGITVDGTIDKLGKSAAIAKQAAGSVVHHAETFTNAGGDLNTNFKLNQAMDEVFFNRDVAKASNGLSKAVTAFSDGATEDEVNKAFDKLDDYKQIRDAGWKSIQDIDPSKLTDGQKQQYQLIYSQLCRMDDRIEKYSNKIMTQADMLDGTADEASSLAERSGDVVDNGKEIAKAANSEQAKEMAQGFLGKALGKAGKILHAYASALATAKIAKFVLNDGKAGIDAIGGQYLKFKEDMNVVAEIKFSIANGKNSKSKHSDTKFSVRFDTSDLKWHVTNLDDRKAKIKEEQKIIDKIMKTDDAKQLKKDCLEKWSEIFEPKDESMKLLPQIIKNSDALGISLKTLDKNQQKYFKTIQRLAQHFDEVKKQFS